MLLLWGVVVALPVCFAIASLVASRDTTGARTLWQSGAYDADRLLGLQAAGPGGDDATAVRAASDAEQKPAVISEPTPAPRGRRAARESTVAAIAVTPALMARPRMPDHPAAIAEAPVGTRDKRRWPFSSESIWNLPIGSDADYVSAGIGAAGRITIDVEYIVFPQPADPLRPVFTNAAFGSGRCSPDQFQFEINLPDDFVVPDAAPGYTPNAPAAILAADGHTLKQMNPISRCEEGGPLTAGWMAPDADIYGDGILGGHGGSGLSSIGGSLRLGELTGTDPIRHALKVELWGHRWLAADDGGYRWPAVTADSYYDDPQSNAAYRGGLPALRMGALLAIPRDFDLGSLGLQTPAAAKIAWTLQNYGAYVVDDTAFDAHALDVEAGVPQEFERAFGYGIDAHAGPWYDDMMRIFGALAVVDNNGPDSVGGGGTPLQPLAPPIGN